MWNYVKTILEISDLKGFLIASGEVGKHMKKAALESIRIYRETYQSGLEI
jgi:hypothetical protein